MDREADRAHGTRRTIHPARHEDRDSCSRTIMQVAILQPQANHEWHIPQRGQLARLAAQAKDRCAQLRRAWTHPRLHFDNERRDLSIPILRRSQPKLMANTPKQIGSLVGRPLRLHLRARHTSRKRIRKGQRAQFVPVARPLALPCSVAGRLFTMFGLLCSKFTNERAEDNTYVFHDILRCVVKQGRQGSHTQEDHAYGASGS